MCNQQKQKIICLGLGRTGTSSLRDALEILGLGPCYHMMKVMNDSRVDDFKFWQKVGAGTATSDEIRELLEPFEAVLDYPPAIYGEALYAAYPNAKYILTTRDPEKWETSMRNTIMKVMESLSQQTNNLPPLLEALRDWQSTDFRKYHRNHLEMNTQQELLDHNERIRRIIPADKLLIYEVSEGWDRLVDFLGVLKPTVPFPHVNDTAQFAQYQEKMAAAAKAFREQSQISSLA